MDAKRILVCGGRDYKDAARVYAELDARCSGCTHVISGMAKGADTIAALWAKLRGKTLMAFPADWNRDGRAAGPIRNDKMLTAMPDIVIAFPGGKGTDDMVSRATRAGVPVVKITADTPSAKESQPCPEPTR